MFRTVFPFLFNQFNRIISFFFNLKIDSDLNITLGEFILACAIIGLAIYFVLQTDFIPFLSSGGSSSSKSTDNNGYVPRHAPGTAGKDFSTRESRHRY